MYIGKYCGLPFPAPVCLNPFLSLTLYFIFENYGVKYSSSTVSAIIIATIPLVTPVGAFIFLKENLGFKNIAGIAISFTGVGVIVMEKGFSINSKWYGLAFLFLSVLSAVGYSIVLKKMTVKYNVFTLTTYQHLLGLLLFLPLFFIFSFREVVNTPLHADFVIPLVELGVLASAVAFLCFTVGIRNLGASRATAFSNTIPVFTVIFAYFILDEILSLQKAIGMAVVIAGLFLAQLGGLRKKPASVC